MSNELLISTNYNPRPLQDHVHRNLKRFNVVICHRRWGKSILAVNELIHRALTLQKFNPQFIYIGPTYSQIKKVAWDMLKLYAKNIPGVEFNESELKCTIPRPWLGDVAKIYLAGSENKEGLLGMYADFVAFDEFDRMDFSVWTSVIRPMLSDRGGGAIFISTVKGRKHMYRLYQEAMLEENQADWARFLYKASETEIIPQKELETARRNMSEEEYLQEYECSWDSANVGSYYAKYMTLALNQGRLTTSVPYNRAYPVDTFWDIGIADTTAIWFRQRVDGKEHIIDHLEVSGMGLEYYIDELTKRGYVYGEHVFPHDMSAQEFGSGRSRIDVFREWAGSNGLGGRARILEKHKVADGISAVRMVLDQCYFDSTKCQRGLEALKAYTKRYDEKNQIFSDKPKHDWASHSADAFRLFAMGKRDHSESYSEKMLTQEHVEADYKYNIYDVGND